MTRSASRVVFGANMGEVLHVTEVLCAVTILLTLFLAILVSVTGLKIWLLGGTASPSYVSF